VASCQVQVAFDGSMVSCSECLTGLANDRAMIPTIKIATTIKNELLNESVES
jgi:hypothetical protein